MTTKVQHSMTGAALALTMAALAGCANTGTSETAQTAMSKGSSDLVHCYGVNTCKGHNDCKTANNACGGHASCKGTGFVAMSAKTCGNVGGNVQDDWVGSISKTELVHCYNVNACKGHNDCKTANNACNGHSSCKGTGFVTTPAKACDDIGGKIGV
ncbi:hypothetical protein HQQ94_07765 [Shewanella sp. VB17]|uniref:BufA2 family periplasmic bufferin-type metallophore n=1 Tax=Shewanella sp. VB17 TaxID=2739432 RepID=UPI0015632F34|nr:hypothetical protein [Shewanella sp. VB17]NRD73137.1 hypothetical protein [Shewanella sp. VB17]